MFLNYTSGFTYYLLLNVTDCPDLRFFYYGVLPAAIPFSLCMIESLKEWWSAMTLVGNRLLPVVSSTVP